MKRILFFFLASCLTASVAQAAVLHELWDKYQNMTEAAGAKAAQSTMAKSGASQKFPGRVLGTAQGKGEASFHFPWKYRAVSYELHYDKGENLARSIYGLALAVKDVSPDLPKEKFFRGVLGFHYGVDQICSWLNAASEKNTLSDEENVFLGLLLQDGVVRLGDKGFEPTGRYRHVLGAAGGKKRSFAQNLRHERLHVFWSEDDTFRTAGQSDWQAMSEDERNAAKAALPNYDQSNEPQLVEEWAIKRAETKNISIR